MQFCSVNVQPSPAGPLVFLLECFLCKNVYLKGTKQKFICKIDFSGKALAASKFTVLKFGLARVCIAFMNVQNA